MDAEDWSVIHPDDLWTQDKLILSKKLGYLCGPHGASVPEQGAYITRPCVNFMGLGQGTKFKYIVNETDTRVELGHFWCEIFEGRHLSVDYQNKQQVLCVEGFRQDLSNFQIWDKWEKVSDKILYPAILEELKGNYEWINVEYIDGKIIEIHFRDNPDFRDHNSDYVIPVWIWDKVEPKKQQEFIESKDGYRQGFYIQKGTLK